MSFQYRIALCVCALLATAVALPASASAQSSGGMAAPGAPSIRVVSCLATADSPCSSRRAVLRGRQFIVRGSGLAAAKRIIFKGRRTRRDDYATRVERASKRYAVATVPRKARSGRVVVVDRYGASAVSRRAVRVRKAPKLVPRDLAPGSRVFYGGRRKATFGFTAARSGQAQVNLVNQESGETVRTWTLPTQAGQHAEVKWDGRGSDGVPASGNYRFQLVGAVSASSVSGGESFFFADHLFPIRGRHNLGYTSTNNFGGGGQRKHMGQDMFARCGTKVAAARGGKVQFAGYHSAAGNYVVIDGAGTGRDYVYMHMLKTPVVKTGQRVFTGQKIGQVGETGRASGCHVHFEMWSGPGWYEGGKAFDPLPELKRWDSFS